MHDQSQPDSRGFRDVVSEAQATLDEGDAPSDVLADYLACEVYPVLDLAVLQQSQSHDLGGQGGG